jgi:UDP-glucose 4-epimerase
MPRVVLVTGVSRDLGARFARTLAAAGRHEVVGVDVLPPRHDLGAVSFVRADIRNPIIAKVIAARSVDTVVHMAMVVTAGSAGGRSAMKEINVIGTMQLLAACQKSETFSKLVVQSSVSVYGASPRDPAKFSEEMSPRAQPRTGFGKDSIEIEAYVRGLARRRPDVAVSTLRLANLMGAGVDSHVTRYLSLPVVPRVMGFDARLQFLHPTDAVEALLWATREDIPGTYNVAADDIVALSQAIRMMGRPSIGVPHFAAPTAAGLIRQARLGDFSADMVDALTYGRAMATDRFAAATAAIDAVGFHPSYTTRQALEEFVGVSRPGLLAPDQVSAALDKVQTALSVRPRPLGADDG